MTYYTSFFVLIVHIISLIFAETGYNTIYLMEFDNLKNDFTNSHLKEALPDLIRENYKFREDIKVEYAGDIRPYLEKNNSTQEDSIKGLIINGSFQTLNETFYIEFEAYDIHNWKQLVKRQIFCPVHDIICVHDAFLISIERNISPFLADDLDIYATILALEKGQMQKNISPHDLDQDNNLNKSEFKQLDEIHLKKDLENIQGGQGKYGNRYYREFDLAQLNPNQSLKFEQNTQKLIQILDQILTNPYDVMIGELSIEMDSGDENMIMAELPIQYSIQSKLAQELMTALPHEKYLDGNSNVILQFSNNDFIFDQVLMEKLALMQFQVMPVIFFNNKIGKPQFIILDSWHENSNRLNPRRIAVHWENQFKPLFALTPGTHQIQMTLDSGTLDARYHFTIPYEKIGDYTKVTVKFMKESELEELLGN